MSRLTDSPASDQVTADGQPAADRPRAAASAADGSRAELRERLRNLAPSHASAIPRESPRSSPHQSAAESPPHREGFWSRPGDSPRHRSDSPPHRGDPLHRGDSSHGGDPPDRDDPPHRGDSPQRDDGIGWRSFDTLKRRFWDQADYFRSLWTDHQQRWPRPATRERLRPDDPPGSWRGPGDRTLSPEDNAQADQVIELLQECEPTVTDALQRLEFESPFGARLVGLEHRLKGSDRLKEKLIDKLQSRPTGDLVEAAAQVSDAVRYTYCFDVEQYAQGYADMHERLESTGYRMIFRANRWIGDPEYRGMNTRWVTPEGDRFELQFHTPESFFAKESLTHDPYDRIRTPGTSRDEEQELLAYERLICAAIPQPEDVAEILDVRPL